MHILGIIAFFMVLWTGPVHSQTVRIFAAASLKPALDEVLADQDVALSYAASGLIARQISLGAPADLLILANSDWMSYLVQKQHVEMPEVLVRNTLVMAQIGRRALSLGQHVTQAKRIAIGDPRYVPAGQYGKIALTAAGLWEEAQSKFVFASDARSALAYLTRGEVELAVVYGSDVIGHPSLTVATELHVPPERGEIIYPMASTKGAVPQTQSIMRLLRSSQAQQSFAQYGFKVVGHD